MNNINLEDFDVDGAIGEQAYAVEGDTRLVVPARRPA